MTTHWQPPQAVTATSSAPAIPRRDLLRGVRSALAAANRFILIRYFFLRATTAAGALIAGLIQTFVFARTLSPEQFSIFVLLASFGTSLALFDFGVVKLLFVRLRAAFLAGRIDDGIAAQATAIVAFYTFLVAVCVLLCTVIFAALPAFSAWDDMQFTLFFLFAALNFVWFALRNISVAIDEFIFFESLEAIRRIGNTALILAVLVGFPLMAFLIAINLLWAALLSVSIVRLLRRRAMTLQLRGIAHSLRLFYSGNRQSLVGSGAYATTEIFVYSFPYIVVSSFFGLGAPTIILDTTLKILRGASQIYLAACDLLVPRQTRAFASRDRWTLVRATWLAAILCGIPAAILCGILIVSADRLFALLLGPIAIMPAEAAPILVALLIANLMQMVSHSLLVHSGFFKEIAKLGIATALAMMATAALAIWAGVDIIGFLKVYTGVYACGALISIVLVLRGPVRSVTQ
jgi:O-antigen/teichoic acid export membrane protein